MCSKITCSPIREVSYTAFLVPGLVMMTVLQNAFRQQLVLADPEQDHRQHRLRAAAAHLLSRVLRRLCDRLVLRGVACGGGRAAGVGLCLRRESMAEPGWVMAFTLIGGAISSAAWG
jgi:hypothetical protein